MNVIRRPLIAVMLAVVAGLVPGSARAADLNLIAAGTVRLSRNIDPPRTCDNVAGIQLKTTGSDFVFTSQWGPGTGDTPPRCQAVLVMMYQSNRYSDVNECQVVNDPSRLTIAGNRYTISSTFKNCAGVVTTRQSVLVVQSAAVQYSVRTTVNGATDFQGSGTLSRLS